MSIENYQFVTVNNKSLNLYILEASKKSNMYIKDYFDIDTKYYKKAINSQRIPSLFILRKL